MTKDSYKAILVILTGFGFLFLITGKMGLLYIAVSVGIIAIVWPTAGEWMVKSWIRIGKAIGWVNSIIILSIIFFAILVPISFLYRLFTKDFLSLSFPASNTLFIERNHIYTKKNLEKMW